MFEGKALKKPVGNNMSCLCAHDLLVRFICRIGQRSAGGGRKYYAVAKEILAAQTTRQVNQLLLEDGERSNQDDDSA